MKLKRLAILFVVVIISTVSFTACKKKDRLPDKPEKIVTAGLQDANFGQGFNLRGMNSATDSGIVKVINYGNASNVPKWELAQWWSKFNLKDGKETITESDYTLSDASKRVELKRKHGALSLAVNGSEEFETFNVVAPAAWPHLLLEQSLRDDLWLKNADEVQVSLDFTLIKNDDLRGGSGGLQAQFAWFIYIVDKNPESSGYGNFLWFGLNIFDSTKVYAPPTAMQDTAGGLGNYIYSLGAQTIMESRVRVGENNKISYDIMPHIESALKKAQEGGFMMGTTVNDCRITGMNIGWEVFDRWDVNITLFNIGIDLIKYEQK